MILYHGTSERHLPSILEAGLLPRDHQAGDTTGNWADTVPSNGSNVYLASGYAPYFAAAASDKGERWVIVEVDTDDLDEDYLVPDEDFLEQATRGMKDIPEWMADLGYPDKGSMLERTLWFRDNVCWWAHLWRDSVKGLGTCGYGEEIDTSCIRRIVAFDPTNYPRLALQALDPSISLMNHRLCAGKYEELTATVLAHGETVYTRWEEAS